MSSIISCKSLYKTYNNKRKTFPALQDFNFNMTEGDFLGLIGPNGAGKTTFIKIITGLLAPSDCQVLEMFNQDISHNISNNLKKNIGLVLNSGQLYGNLTAIENLNFFSKLYKIDHSVDVVHSTLKQVGLFERKNDLTRQFSTGMKQRLNIARALVTGAKLLILDEPTSGLDPVSARSIYELLNQINSQGVSILLCTHNMAEIEELCDKVFLINRGRNIIEGSVDDLKSSVSRRTLKIKLNDLNDDINVLRKKLNDYGIRKFLIKKEKHVNKLIIFSENKELLPKLNLNDHDFEQHSTTLEDVFLYHATERVDEWYEN